ncbi:hypothetical protein Ae201684P_014483 [Aphanomyces euteiches]|nr:hypothetical protein Ae201684P_014483 [Aphanomyces euteiches]
MLFVLTIEPLAQMLRNHPEYGYAFSDSGIASVLLFADDTTLISSSVGDLESQLELVDEFCRHSGAKLNRNKSKVLTLDNTQSVFEHPRLNMVPSGTPVKYLGIELGHQLDPMLQINPSATSFTSRLPHGRVEQETLKGRRLLVSTMILSQLLHYTMVLPIPDKYRAKMAVHGQQVVMSRRTLAEDKYLALAPSGLIHDSKTGFKVPHIASVIRKQRVTRLQLLVQADQDEPPQWQSYRQIA